MADAQPQLPPIASPRLRSPPRQIPAPPVGDGHARVIHAMYPQLHSHTAKRSRRMRAARPDVVDKVVAQHTAHDEAVRKRLARDYDDRVTSRFMVDLSADAASSQPGSARGGGNAAAAANGADGADGGAPLSLLQQQHGSARRSNRPSNILKETETQTLVAGGDARTAGRQAVSLGSKRLNTLATVVANNPLLQSMNSSASRTGFVTAKAPIRDNSAPIAPSASMSGGSGAAGPSAAAGLVKGSVSASARGPAQRVGTAAEASAFGTAEPLAGHAVEATPTRHHAPMRPALAPSQPSL